MTTPVVKEPGRSWWDLRQVARTRLCDLASGSLLDVALAKFFLSDENLLPIDFDKFISAFTPTATNTAILGLLIERSAAIGTDAEQKFLDGIDRCVKQQPPTSGPSVHTDPKLLLGLTVGLAAIKGSGARKVWLESQLSSLTSNPDLMKSIIGSFSLTLLGNIGGWRSLEETLRKVELKYPADATIALWALQLEPTHFSDTTRGELDRVRKSALELFPLIEVDCLDIYGCAFTLLIASRLLQASVWDLEKTAFDRLASILNRLPVALAREEHEPRNEYDIQRVLWTMLAGVYPDLRDEQWIAGFGVYQPRTDLAIESMKTIVEAKYIKKTSSFRSVQDELIADATTYTQKPERFDKIVAVIYDDTSSQHKYDQMRTDLKKVSGIADIIIIPKVSPRPTTRTSIKKYQTKKRKTGR